MPRQPPISNGGRKGRSRSSDRAVSEVLSYALIFGLILVSIGIVTVGGMGSLNDARTNEHLSNAERAYDVLHDNMADVHSEGAPSRSTEISLGDSQLFFDDNVTMRVETLSDTYEREIRPIVFRIDGDRRVVYEAGATIRTARQGGIVKNEPPFLLTDEAGGRIHIPIIQTTSESRASVGSTTVLVRGESTERTVLQRDLRGGVLENIEIDSPRTDAWDNYFENQDYCSSVTVTGTAVTCDVDPSYGSVQHLYVTVQQIEVSLIN